MLSIITVVINRLFAVLKLKAFHRVMLLVILCHIISGSFVNYILYPSSSRHAMRIRAILGFILSIVEYDCVLLFVLLLYCRSTQYSSCGVVWYDEYRSHIPLLLLG